MSENAKKIAPDDQLSVSHREMGFDQKEATLDSLYRESTRLRALRDANRLNPERARPLLGALNTVIWHFEELRKS
jgi:hypothetical protein